MLGTEHIILHTETWRRVFSLMWLSPIWYQIFLPNYYKGFRGGVSLKILFRSSVHKRIICNTPIAENLANFNHLFGNEGKLFFLQWWKCHDNLDLFMVVKSAAGVALNLNTGVLCQDLVSCCKRCAVTTRQPYLCPGAPLQCCCRTRTSSCSPQEASTRRSLSGDLRLAPASPPFRCLTS